MDSYASTPLPGDGQLRDPGAPEPVPPEPVPPGVGAPGQAGENADTGHDSSGGAGLALDPRAEGPHGTAIPDARAADPDAVDESAPTDPPAQLFASLAVYTLLRLALVAVLTAVLVSFMPLIVALLFAIIIQLPLSWLMFARPRRRVNEAIAQSSAHRRAERERLRAALAGQEPGH